LAGHFSPFHSYGGKGAARDNPSKSSAQALDFPSLRASDLCDAVNYRICELCQGRFLADSSNSRICSRPLCKAVRMATQHKRSREQRR
jgi:hypothetical protein